MGKRSILIRVSIFSFYNLLSYVSNTAITQSNYPEKLDLQQAVVNKSYQSGPVRRGGRDLNKYKYQQHNIDHPNERSSFGFLNVIYNTLTPCHMKHHQLFSITT